MVMHSREAQHNKSIIMISMCSLNYSHSNDNKTQPHHNHTLQMPQTLVDDITQPLAQALTARVSVEGANATHVILESGQATGRLWCGRTWFLPGDLGPNSCAVRPLLLIPLRVLVFPPFLTPSHAIQAVAKKYLAQPPCLL